MPFDYNAPRLFPSVYSKLANADVIKGGCSMMTVADKGGSKIAQMLLTTYVNDPLMHRS